ncbi:hypothetical protein P4N68_07015 [Corynebacterium felinum]|uniref:Uncharacterized protein n=1 Tax=Corynebacterium felinum TaxID=131318 RepID=A0ABU2B971_9CORY|nr:MULTISPECIES: hypothetical protein [Corynebacterium]MDF5820832.1 hypothetical protein [Corynebacterium felinum]MDO4761007.1 hypothetical protein [Corynebacterium sp.]MDR7355158.1 hypothetical protein [Corynebacterium felinum]WJY94509.1 hypothetical protein CFELI_04395 [Corynebacterium felinum]
MTAAVRNTDIHSTDIHGDLFNTRDLNTADVYYLSDLNPYEAAHSYYIRESHRSRSGYSTGRIQAPEQFARLSHRTVA